MIEFLSPHIGTIIVGLALLIVVVSIVLKIVRDKRKGKCCGCGSCGGCPDESSCSTKQ